MRSRPMLLVRLWAWALAIRVLKYLVPVDTLVRVARPRRPPEEPDRMAVERVLEILRTPGGFPLRAPANCLDRSLAAYRMLCASGARPTLAFGIRKVAGRLDGHAWVVVGDRPVAEPPAFIETFVPVLTIDANGRRSPEGAALPEVRFA